MGQGRLWRDFRKFFPIAASPSNANSLRLRARLHFGRVQGPRFKFPALFRRKWLCRALARTFQDRIGDATPAAHQPAAAATIRPNAPIRLVRIGGQRTGLWASWTAGGGSHQPCVPSGRSRMGACVLANVRSGQAWAPRLLFWFHSRDATHTGLRSLSPAGTRPATSPSSGFHHPTLNRRRPPGIPALPPRR